MSFDADAALEALTVVTEAVRESGKLQTWFQELARMAEGARRDAILRVTQEMQARREPEELVSAFGLLIHPRLFAAVLSALRDFGIRV